MNNSKLSIFVLTFLVSCAPQREFVRFSDSGNFRAPSSVYRESSGDEEYDSYELIDQGAPNHGVPPMYGGNHRGYSAPNHYQTQGGGYPRTEEVYDQYGNARSVIIPNPW